MSFARKKISKIPQMVKMFCSRYVLFVFAIFCLNKFSEIEADYGNNTVEAIRSNFLDIGMYLMCLKTYKHEIPKDVSSYIIDIAAILLKSLSQDGQVQEEKQLHKMEMEFRDFVKHFDVRTLHMNNLKTMIYITSKCIDLSSYDTGDFVTILRSFMETLLDKIEQVHPSWKQQISMHLSMETQSNDHFVNEPELQFLSVKRQMDIKHTSVDSSMKSLAPPFVQTSNNISRFNSFPTQNKNACVIDLLKPVESTSFSSLSPDKVPPIKPLDDDSKFELDLKSGELKDIDYEDYYDYYPDELEDYQTDEENNFFGTNSIDEDTKSISVPLSPDDSSFQHQTLSDQNQVSVLSSDSFSSGIVSECAESQNNNETGSEQFRKEIPAISNKSSNKKTFSSVLLNELALFDNIPEFFDLKLPAQQVKSILNSFLNEVAEFIGLPEPNGTQWVLQVPNVSLNFATIVVQSLEKFLTLNSLLNFYNAEELAQAYYKTVTEAVNVIPYDAAPAQYIKALMNASQQFMSGLILLDLNNNNSFASILVNEINTTNPLTDITHNVNQVEAVDGSFLKTILDLTPEILSPIGLSSKEATIRIQKLSDAIVADLTLAQILIILKNYFIAVSEIYKNRFTLSSEVIVIEVLLEIISAIIKVLHGL